MATNKNAAIRYRIIDSCLSNSHRRYTFNDLLDAINTQLREIHGPQSEIKIRTLREDIRHLRSPEGGKAPIETYKKDGKTYYRYGQKDFKLYNQGLNAAEVQQLKTALDTLSKIEGVPQMGWVQELSAKLEETFFLERTEQMIMSYDSNKYLKGIEYLGQLFHAILNKKVLSIQYKSYKSDMEQCFLLHPYHLREYNNRWFLFGKNNGYQNLTNLALDRIIKIEEMTQLDFQENEKWDFNEYFEDIIGVSITSGELIEVILCFNKDAAPYVLSKPLHGSQRIVSCTESDLVISIQVYPNYELESLILSFGERVIVQKPTDLRERIADRLRNGLDKYV